MKDSSSQRAGSLSPEILIVGSGRIGGLLGGRLLEGFLRGDYELQRLWYLGRTEESANATVLDHRHDFILRAGGLSDKLERARALRAVSVAQPVGEASDLSRVSIVVLAFGSSTANPSERRAVLYDEHAAIVRALALSCKSRINTDAIWLSVVNPVEEICMKVCDEFDLAAERVIGIGATHDTARLVDVTHRELGRTLDEVLSWGLHIVGPHDERMQASWESTPRDVVDVLGHRIMQLTRDSGLKILRARGLPPVFAPTQSLFMLIQGMLSGVSRRVSACVFSRKHSCFMGMLALIGVNGVIEIYEPGEASRQSGPGKFGNF